MRMLKKVAIAVAAIIVLALVVLYAGSEWVIRSSHAVPLDQIAARTDAASVAEGGRLARAFGCRDCHAPDGTGAVMVDSPVFGRLATPAFARIAADHSDAEIARAVRHGVRKDGSAIWIMPIKAYNFIADDDLAMVIGWMRTLKPSDRDQLKPTSFGPVGRALILFGALKSGVTPGSAFSKTRPADFGRYIVGTSCTGCHALDHEQPSDDGKQIVPALAPMAAAYDLPSFAKLLRTGVGKSNRDLGQMREVALGAYSKSLTDAEIKAIHDYLTAEAERQAK